MQTLDTVRQALDAATNDSLLTLIRAARDRQELAALRILAANIPHTVAVETAMGLREVELRAKTTAYGYCPVCGAIGQTREQWANGYDTCANGHRYQSNTAVK